jgi:hypothetical protein
MQTIDVFIKLSDSNKKLPKIQGQHLAEQVTKHFRGLSPELLTVGRDLNGAKTRPCTEISSPARSRAEPLVRGLLVKPR